MKEPTSDTSIDTSPISGGDEHILFIDDDTALAEVGGKILEYLGYQATCFTSSLKALECFQETPFQFDLAITDQVMPDLTGVELAGEILKIRPEFPIILTTGFSLQISTANINERGIKRLLKKPLGIREIARVIREVLDENRD